MGNERRALMEMLLGERPDGERSRNKDSGVGRANTGALSSSSLPLETSSLGWRALWRALGWR
jgi:hypothetical protein